ncbi:hypothetical protein LTR66_015606, partial [Elasticomyces elasticus]
SAWRTSSSLANNEKTVDYVTSIIQKLNSILEDESRKAAPHACLLYVAANQIYIIVAKLAISSEHRDVITASTQFFHFLINGEVDGILDSRIFARSLVDLVRRCAAPATIVVDVVEETALIELLFEIATKARLDPDILPAWFYPERAASQTRGSVLEARRSQFPLFYVLVDYVHHDGAIGDFARTALLYLTETASKSRTLEKWMLESDLAQQMASGLSALYSRLSRKPLILDEKSLPILAFSDVGRVDGTLDQEVESGEESIRAFLSYLAFWQDTLTHCKPVDVRDTMLDAFQVLFVEQLLYPSLLESSDVQSGSTSAVLLNLCQILEAIEQPELVSRMLNYLFASKAEPVLRPDRPKASMSLSRRASRESLAVLSRMSESLSPDLFNLHDLIIFSLRSSIPQTIMSTLRLISVLLRRHHSQVQTALLLTHEDIEVKRQNLNSMNSTMLTMFDYAKSISQSSNFDSMYQALIEDSCNILARHSCLLEDDAEVEMHPVVALSSDCKVSRQLKQTLSSWFSNDTTVNIELTGVFSNLAACQHILMSSWFVQRPYAAEDSEGKPDNNIEDIFIRLVDQVKSWRLQYVEWDTFYSIQQFELGNPDDTLGMIAEEQTLLSDASTTFSEKQERYAQQVTDIRVDSIESRLARSPATFDMNEDDGLNDKLRATSQARSISSGTLSATLLETQIPLPTTLSVPTIDIATGNDLDKEEQTAQKTASLRHILTQAIVLQSLILELAAMLQTRATLFDEVELS